MRSHPSCWNKTLARLGFRRKRSTRRTHGWGRSPRLETLEARQMMSITVNTLVDENDGIGDGEISLREAVANAAAYGNQVLFHSALNGGRIALTGGELLLPQSITIAGPGADLLTVDAQGASRVFYINASAGVTISGLSITGGNAASGGGGIWNNGNLTLTSATVAGNHTAAVGGGVYVSETGTLTTVASTFDNNHAVIAGGGSAG